MKIPSCFNNLIVLRDTCGYDLPKSGLFLDDLIDSALSTLSDISSSTGKELFESIYKRSVMELICEVENYTDVNLKIQLNNIISTEQIGYRTNEYNTAANKERGFYVKKYSSSKIKKIHLGKVGILANNTETVIINLIDGDEIVSKTVDTYPGRVVYLDFNHTANSDIIYVLANNNTALTCKSTVKPPESSNYPCCGSCNFTKNPFLEIAGFNGLAMVDNTYGLFADVSLYCDKSYIYCAMADDLALPLLYKLGYNVALAAIQSERLNQNINAEFWRPISELYLEKFNFYLNAALAKSEKIISSIDHQCIICRGNKIINTHF